jgi:hypothetical protein
MKKLYTLLAFSLFQLGNAQVINFPDIDFKNALLGLPSGPTCAFDALGNNLIVDADGNGEIEQSEALAVYQISINNNAAINDLTGIEFFTNVDQLIVMNTSCTILNTSTLVNLRNVMCNDNSIGALDFSNAMALETVQCQNNQLTALLMPDTDTIWKLDCSNNQLTSLSVGFFGVPAAPSHFSCAFNQLTQLDIKGSFDDIDVTYNQLATLDFSQCTTFLFPPIFYGNPPLMAVNLKNGDDDTAIIDINFATLPNLQYICLDDAEIEPYQTYINNQGQAGNVHINTYCSFQPGGTYASATGDIRFDANGDGCDASDISVPGLRIDAYDELTLTGSAYFSGADGHYSMDLVGSFYQIVPSVSVQHPEYFTVSPESFSADLFSTNNIAQDICIIPNGTHHNVSVAILPLSDVRPGNQAAYRIVCRNIGTTVESGSVTFNYNDALTDFSGSSIAPTTQSTGQLSWDYSALQPFEIRTIDITLNVGLPTSVPPVNLGTLLFSEAVIAATSDEELINNTASLQQEAVNSLDPNDKICLEGATIDPDMAGEYVHYMIRFENTGTANALNVVVTDVIDATKFDLSSLVPLQGSDEYQMRIIGDRVEFFFEGINLPFDDAHNDGYVVFQIRTKPELVLGDTFSNTADIYFDYNFPIVTNTATTTLELLKTQDFTFSDRFVLYPNPAKGSIAIESKSHAKIESVGIYNMLGQMVLELHNMNGAQKIDVSGLKSGNYLIKINTDAGVSHSEFIKQ